MEWALDNTFKDTKIEFEDLDGLSWPGKPASPQTAPNSPALEPLFTPGKHTTPMTIYETSWVSAPSSPACCQCDLDRSVCQLHTRKLSRSRRTSGVTLTFPRVEDPDPFALVSTPSVLEEKSVPQERSQSGTAKQTESRSRPFRLLALPSDEVSSIGPPPGLPSPLPGFQPLRGVPFPTQV